MKAKVITLTSAMLLALSCFSQDILIFKNGVEVRGNVIETTPAEVKFKRAENSYDTLHTILKSDLFIILYENGSKEILSPKAYKKRAHKKKNLRRVLTGLGIAVGTCIVSAIVSWGGLSFD